MSIVRSMTHSKNKGNNQLADDLYTPFGNDGLIRRKNNGGNNKKGGGRGGGRSKKNDKCNYCGKLGKYL